MLPQELKSHIPSQDYLRIGVIPTKSRLVHGINYYMKYGRKSPTGSTRLSVQTDPVR